MRSEGYGDLSTMLRFGRDDSVGGMSKKQVLPLRQAQGQDDTSIFRGVALAAPRFVL